MRTAFIQQLVTEAINNPKIFLIVGDLGYSVVEPFANEFPERFLNAGVAEQNMTGIASGLAMQGYTVFTYSIANFPTLRCMEQIRYDVCYHNLDVKIVAVGGGYAYASLGPSHHATEELGMLRSIPGITIAAPGDPIEAKAITTLLSNTYGPAYIRLGKAGEPVIHTNNLNIEIGKPIEVIKGVGKCVFTTGAMLKYAYDHINHNKFSWGLYSFPIIKPLDKQAVSEVVKSYAEIVTLEEHQLSCGFGSAILEAINDLVEDGSLQSHPKVKRIAIKDEFISIAGSQQFIREKAGLIL
ncbi:MAG: transketolase C-terminal domain-containing protein [Bacteroidota bacterium]